MRYISKIKIFLIFIFITLVLVRCYSTRSSHKPPENSAFRSYENALIFKYDAKWDSALVQINKAIALNDRIALFYVLKAQIFDSLGQIDSAIAAYQQALNVRPYAPEVMEATGELYIHKGDVDKGIGYLQKAFSFDETQTGLLLRIASLYLQCHRLSLAKDVLNDYRVRMELAHLKPKAKFYLLMGDIAFLEKKWQAAAEYYEACPCKSCFSEEQALRAFNVLFKGKKYDSYFRLLTGVDQSKFKNGILFYYRGLYYSAIGNLNEAEHQFRLALQHGNQKPELFYELAQVYKKRNEPEKIKELARRLQKIAPQSSYLSKMKALLH